MTHQQHQSDSKILDRRTLWNDHRVLAELLSPGMSVLDVGCGTGAITKGIAEAVGPNGIVVGVDRDRGLIERARLHCASLPNLRFDEGDATSLAYEAQFDIVSAARTLQWVADVQAALRNMVQAVRPGGMLVVLDYNHTRNAWEPSPPVEFAEFYARFLSWRESNGWDNEMANHLPALFEGAGLQEIRTYNQDVTSVKGDNDFDQKTALWTDVIDNIGPTLIGAKVCEPELVDTARRSYDLWRKRRLERHTLSMKAIVATVPRTTKAR